MLIGSEEKTSESLEANQTVLLCENLPRLRSSFVNRSVSALWCVALDAAAPPPPAPMR